MEEHDEVMVAAILAAAEAFGLYAQWLRDSMAEKEAEAAWEADEALMRSMTEDVRYCWNWCEDNA